jgi:hypothetical protein
VRKEVLRHGIQDNHEIKEVVLEVDIVHKKSGKILNIEPDPHGSANQGKPETHPLGAIEWMKVPIRPLTDKRPYNPGYRLVKGKYDHTDYITLHALPFLIYSPSSRKGSLFPYRKVGICFCSYLWSVV